MRNIARAVCLLLALMIAEPRRAARMPMIATTTRSSTRVKPDTSSEEMESFRWRRFKLLLFIAINSLSKLVGGTGDIRQETGVAATGDG